MDLSRVIQTVLVGAEQADLDASGASTNLVQRVLDGVMYTGYVAVEMPADQFTYSDHRMWVLELAQIFKKNTGVDPHVYLFTKIEHMVEFNVPTDPQVLEGKNNDIETETGNRV